MKYPLPQQRFGNLHKLGKITVPYGGSTRYEQFHPGVDIANAKGTPIKAPASGVVTDAVGGKVLLTTVTPLARTTGASLRELR